ncbi:hypothetical protein B5C34_03260 [Pacificimonas flava]|uniref:diguanylate cyclase n=2 Tax=Pacificimonas TaxID=1960290 RepID=A0A219B2H1_9SPHN|nr:MULTISPECIES: sensor domain-containing diguanylate cyclase [Pacificimonas]MBZ6377762.1 diguanylate cyclase [Pacificimonas aurantium]OWV32562.1 hypothetical protein B5C34_03260 [Pacificimonas flava]
MSARPAPSRERRSRIASLWKQRTLATQAAAVLTASFSLVLLLVAAIAYFEARRAGVAAALSTLDDYNQQVTSQQEQVFRRISAAHQVAERLLRREAAGLDDGEAQRQFAQLFPRQGDGTRRSADKLYNGGITPVGFVEGVGAFIPPGLSIEPETAIAALRAVSTVGMASTFDLESLYFFTPENALVIFAPDRPDGLRYYREDAPADLDFQDREFATVVRPERNSARTMQCTSLGRIEYDQTGTVWTAGCMTPVDDQGEFVGAFGTSILLEDVLPEGLETAIRSSETIIVSDEGQLIHHPRYLRQDSSRTGDFLDLPSTDVPELQALWRFIEAQGADPFLGRADRLNALVAKRYVDAPGWHILSLRSQDEIGARAGEVAQGILRIGVPLLILLMLMTFLIVRSSVVAPLGALLGRLDEIQARVLPHSKPVQDNPAANELKRISQRFARMSQEIIAAQNRLEGEVAERTEELRRTNAQLTRLSQRDPLTDVPNRRYIMQRLEQHLSNARAHPLSLLIVDLDHFKSVNDRHGHPVGDEVLRRAARRLQSTLSADAELGRIGGEEFLILIPEGGRDVAARTAARICQAMREEHLELPSGGRIHITVSIGGATERDGEEQASLYSRADARLYRAKARGRDRAICIPEDDFPHGPDAGPDDRP